MREPRIPPFEPFFQSARKMKPPRPVRSRGLSVVARAGFAECYTEPKSYGLTLFLSHLPLPLPFFERRTRFVHPAASAELLEHRPRPLNECPAAARVASPWNEISKELA